MYEGKYAESKADFVHKLKISRKECAETIFWIDVLIDSEIVSREKLSLLKDDAERIGRILTSIIKTQ